MNPIVQAFLLADHVYQDTISKKVVIAGCFNRVIRQAESAGAESPGPKYQAGSPFVYLNLVSVKGVQALDLRWVDLSDNRVLLELQLLGGPPRDILECLEFIIRMPLLPFPHSGVYALELLAKDEPLASWRVTAVDGEAQEPQR